MVQVISLLHKPVYTYPQVDRLLGLTSGTASRWINGHRRGRRTYEPIIGPESRNTTWVTWGEYIEGQVTIPDGITGPDWRRNLVFRTTDEAVRWSTGLIPLSVAADRIGHTAMRCAGLLARLALE